jgi:hypothetical protein
MTKEQGLARGMKSEYRPDTEYEVFDVPSLDPLDDLMSFSRCTRFTTDPRINKRSIPPRTQRIVRRPVGKQADILMYLKKSRTLR